MRPIRTYEVAIDADALTLARALLKQGDGA